MMFEGEFCRVNGVDSKIGEIEVDVPHGSCLGPLLFLIYINDCPQPVQDFTVSMCADDTSFCHQSHDLTLLNEAINSDLKKLGSWLQGNRLSLNVTKTHSMLISTKQKQNILKSQNEDLDLKIRDNELEVFKRQDTLVCKSTGKELEAVSSKVARAVGVLKHAKFFSRKKRCRLSTRALWSPTFDTAALSGAA